MKRTEIFYINPQKTHVRILYPNSDFRDFTASDSMTVESLAE